MAIDKSNPNTRRLINYWVRDEGAAKIRWGTDGSFNRCVRNLSDKVRDPKGLCAELHKEATGEWPAEEGVESALLDTPVFELSDDEIENLIALNAAMEESRSRAGIKFKGLIAPADKPTGDKRMFPAGALSYRRLPRPVNFQVATSQGHAQSVTVGKLERVYFAEDGWHGEGTFLDPRIVPEVTRAIYLLQEGVYGPSVDVDDVTYELAPHPYNAEDHVVRFSKARIMGFTLVPFPAFAEVEITVDDPDQFEVLLAAGVPFAVNAASWKKMPLASRDLGWDADEAIARLIEWSGGQPAKYKTAFLYIDEKGDATSRDSYRLPIADVIDGKLTLVPHAVYAAAALLSGAHGGLPNVPDDQKDQIRDVITEIYSVFQSQWSDPRVKPPWLRGGRDKDGQPTKEQELSADDAVFSVGEITDAEVIHYEFGTAETVQPPRPAPEFPVRPPAAWFTDPQLSGPTQLTVGDDGRVYGHLAAWNVCHTGIGNRCVTAPHSITGYKHFKVGNLVVDNGQTVQVGKITLGGGHADPQLGFIPAAEHYDNTCSAVAVVNVGEDKHGIWVAGALVPGLSAERVAELRRSPLSGDWRRIGGNLELVAALAVNSPGFPVIRASGEEDLTLLAAGIVDRPEPVPSDTSEVDPGQLDSGKFKRLAALDKAVQAIASRDKRMKVESIFGKEIR